MKIKKPNDVVFVDNITQRALLEAVCSNRSGALKTFFSQNKDIFLDDNDRFYTDFPIPTFTEIVN